MLLVPLVLRTSADQSAPAFDVSTGPIAAPAETGGAAPSTTWLPPDRVVEGAEMAAPARPTTTASSTTTVGTRAGAPPTSTPSSAAVVTTTTVAASARPPAPTTTVATTTTKPLAVTLPAALTPIAPAQRSSAPNVERGLASWFNTADETCAHRTAPFGTVITVTRHFNGAVTRCTVNDWGPADTTRVIDLSMDTFEKLADPGAGLVEVTIEW